MAFAIRRVTVQRYRSLQDFTWYPKPRLNVMVGSADGGKSTILSAIALLLYQGIPGPRSEFDYFNRRVTEGFTIEAVIGDIDFAALAGEGKQLPLFGLSEDGKLYDLPEAGLEPVILVRATGTADFEVLHEILLPNGDTMAFGLSLRRRIGTLRVTDDSSSARALRITPGSLLGRQFSMSDLRRSVREALADVDNSLPLSEETIKIVDSLEEAFRSDGLPTNLDLGLVSPQGSDLVSMVELVRGDDAATAIPIGLSGSGTRALMTLNVLARATPEQAVVLFEEPERGLEPFSQRIAATRLIELSKRGQAFVTTHSPIVLEGLAEANVWRIECDKAPIALSDQMIVALFKTDAEALFSPVALICEGSTECGFLSVMLPHLIGKYIHTLGIRLVDGQGQPGCLDLAEKLVDAGMTIALFVDNEADHATKRNRVAAKTRSFVWNGATNLEEAVAKHVPYATLPRLMEAARIGVQYALCQLRDALPPKTPPTPVDWHAIVASEPETDVRNAIFVVSCRYRWYKTFDNGAALAQALIDAGIPDEIKGQLDAFAQRVQ
ncbi:MAG: AAA family ATPase [Candidatus Cybelea sp.]